MSDPVAILVSVLLLAGNAFFVGAEFALLSSRRDRLEELADRGVARARIVIAASKEISLMLAGAQLGITICSLLLGRIGEPAVAHVLEAIVSPASIPGGVLHPVAFAISMFIVVVAHILLGEMVPKNLSIAAPERLAVWLIPPHRAFVTVMRPMIVVFNVAANAVLKAIRVQPKDELASAYTSAELAHMVGESYADGQLGGSQHERLRHTIAALDRTVTDVLTPIEELVTVPDPPSAADIHAAVARTGFSRFPVRGSNGELAGYVHVKDLLDANRIPHQVAVRRLAQLPPETGLAEAMAMMRQSRSHLAAVIDSAGTVHGVVALEDVLEEYVGRVRDSTHVAA